MASGAESEKTKLVSESPALCCTNCPEALRIEWRLVPYKAYYFFYYAAINSLVSFLSVYFKQLGMSPTQIGMISSVKPIVEILSVPLCGVIGDKFRIRKVILLGSIAALMGTFLIIGHLPTPTEANTCPLGLPPVANASEIQSELIHGYKLDIRWTYREKDVTHLFTLLLVCLTTSDIFWLPIGALGDAALLSVLDEAEKHKYSHQRSWGPLAAAIFQLITGAALQSTIYYKEICGLNIRFTNYRVAIYILTGALSVTFIASSLFKFKYEPTKEARSPEESMSEIPNSIESTSTSSVIAHDDGVQTMAAVQSPVLRKLRKAKFSLSKFVRLLCSVHYGSWLLCLCYMGFCDGIFVGFLFWYLEELGGDNLLIGVTGGVASGTEFLFYYVSFWFIDKLGPIKILYVSLIIYALRFTNYGLMVNPWLVLPSEVLHGFTAAIGWAALVKHASHALPTCYLAAILGILHGIYWGLGAGCGNLIAGVIIDAIGAKNMFTMFIGVTVAVAGLFCLAQQLSDKPVYVYDDDEEEEMVVKTD